MKRYAMIYSTSEQIASYMPGNYEVLAVLPEYVTERLGERYPGVTVIKGEDSHGWTLDDYVIPRLQSGMYHSEEIDLSHNVMMSIPEKLLDTEWYLKNATIEKVSD